LVSPPVLIDLLAAGNTSPMASVRSIVSAGDKLTAPIRSTAAVAFPKADIIEYYGASELSFVTIAKTSEQAPNSSVGRAFLGVGLEIRDGGGAPVAEGVTGTVWVKSDMLFTGYVGPAPAAFRRDGDWATVGDQGYLSSEGWLTLTGRENHMIISAGFNVSPQSVEAMLVDRLDAPVCVVGVDDARWGQVVCAVKEQDAAWTPQEVEAAKTEVPRSLPRSHVPLMWRSVRSFPRLSSQKIDRIALTRMLSEVNEER